MLTGSRVMTNNISVSPTCAIHEGISSSHLPSSRAFVPGLFPVAAPPPRPPLHPCKLCLLRWGTRAGRAAPRAGVPMISVLLSVPFPLKSHPSISSALFARRRAGVFTELSTKTPKIRLLIQNCSIRAHYCVHVRIYLEFVVLGFFFQALLCICRR